MPEAPPREAQGEFFVDRLLPSFFKQAKLNLGILELTARIAISISGATRLSGQRRLQAA